MRPVGRLGHVTSRHVALTLCRPATHWGARARQGISMTARGASSGCARTIPCGYEERSTAIASLVSLYYYTSLPANGRSDLGIRATIVHQETGF